MTASFLTSSLASFLLLSLSLSLLLVPIHAAVRPKSCVYNIRTGFFEPKGCLPDPRNLSDCSVCNANNECQSNYCLKHRCVKRHDAGSQRFCFGPRKLPLCAECWLGPECGSGTCLDSKCMHATKSSVDQCFRSVAVEDSAGARASTAAIEPNKYCLTNNLSKETVCV